MWWNSSGCSKKQRKLDGSRLPCKEEVLAIAGRREARRRGDTCSGSVLGPSMRSKGWNEGDSLVMRLLQMPAVGRGTWNQSDSLG